MLLSIIIPIYNGALHLRQTIESVLASGIEAFPTEILLVDDGSTDSTPQICNYYVENYPSYFKYFYKLNGGLSSARNYGVEQATGDFIYFLDDDDRLRPDSLRTFYNTYYDPQYDIIGFSCDTIRFSADLRIERGLVGTVVFDGYGMDYLNRRTPTFVWVYWYKKSFLIKNSLSFTITYPEDVMFNLVAFRINPRVLITSQKVICYMDYQEEGQLTKIRDPEKLRAILNGYMTYFQELASSRDKYNLSYSAVRLSMIGQIVPFVSRCLSSKIKRREFADYKHYLKEWSLLNLLNGNLPKLTMVAVHILVYNHLFPIYRFLYKNLFVRFVLPRLSRG